MGKQRKKKGSQTPKRNPGKSKAIFWGIGGILAGVTVFLVFFYLLPAIHFDNKKGKSFSVFGGETHPVLDPLLFSGMARSAYAAAKKYPQVMDQVYCYCKCDEPPVNHISLLSCFTDRHGAGWLLCQKEALRAAQLYKEGKKIEEIKAAIDKEFAR